jgi:hypothetical protein
MTTSPSDTALLNPASTTRASENLPPATLMQLARACLAHAQILLGVAVSQIGCVLMKQPSRLYGDYDPTQTEQLRSNLEFSAISALGVSGSITILGIWMMARPVSMVMSKAMQRAYKELWHSGRTPKWVVGFAVIACVLFAAAIFGLLWLNIQKLLSSDILDASITFLHLAFATVPLVGAYLRVQQAIKYGFGRDTLP